MAGKIKVEATMLGYMYHRRIRPGEKFLVSESAFSEKWMKKLGGKQAKEVVIDEEPEIEVEEKIFDEDEDVI